MARTSKKKKDQEIRIRTLHPTILSGAICVLLGIQPARAIVYEEKSKRFLGMIE